MNVNYSELTGRTKVHEKDQCYNGKHGHMWFDLVQPGTFRKIGVKCYFCKFMFPDPRQSYDWDKQKMNEYNEYDVWWLQDDW